MAIKVYISGICGSHDVRKTQQRVLFILSTLPVDLEIIDVTEPGREQDRTFMQDEVRKRNKKDLLPPQIFNNDQYCGNYDDFQLAADDDVLMSFLKLEEDPVVHSDAAIIEQPVEDAITQNGVNNVEKEAEEITVEETAVHETKEDEAIEQTGEEIKSSEPSEVLNENAANPEEGTAEVVKQKEESSEEDEESEEESD